MIAAMLWRAGYKCLKNDGIDWRDTHYPLAQLRAGQRVKLMRIPESRIARLCDEITGQLRLKIQIARLSSGGPDGNLGSRVRAVIAANRLS